MGQRQGIVRRRVDTVLDAIHSKCWALTVVESSFVMESAGSAPWVTKLLRPCL